MRTFPLIKADLLIDNVGDDIRRNSLLSQCALRYEREPSLSNTNDGCWRSNFEYIGMDWLYKEVHDMVKICVDGYLQSDPSYASRLNPKGFHVEHWTNINDPGSVNRIHSHAEFDFVGVYYIQGEGTGELTFHNPANLLTNCSLNAPFTSRMCYEPKDGDLIIWPAWMPHEVEMNKSNKKRVNIAFNIKL